MAATLLVVEDDDDVRDLTVSILREEGYRVLQAANGGVAMVMLDQDLPIDLLFTDVVMPGGPDGFELANLAKQRRPELKVIYTTGYAGLARATKEMPLHGKILSKPYRPAEIATEVRQLLLGAAGA
jgi:DNA-binding NtrC family response regulator